jgi:hypothetical protein
MAEDNDWEEIWNARLEALEKVFGQSYHQIYHAPHPFQLGGFADVVAFEKHLNGIVYVTAELCCKPEASYADYELMICHREPDDWGPNIISRLAPYTQEAHIGAGETMDIDKATPADSRIKAFLFDTYATFTLFETEFELRLCIGITADELAYKMNNEQGGEKLLNLLKTNDVYPFTDLKRDSIALPK